MQRHTAQAEAELWPGRPHQAKADMLKPWGRTRRAAEGCAKKAAHAHCAVRPYSPGQVAADLQLLQRAARAGHDEEAPWDLCLGQEQLQLLHKCAHAQHQSAHTA